METGSILLQLGFVLALGATALAARPALGRGKSRAAGPVFVAHAIATLGALIVLCTYFVGHRFEFEYVARFSSRALSPALTLASVWAGQEGSILLWAALGALAGLALMRQPGSLARPAMFFVGLFQSWLLLLLMVRSPFVHGAVAPADGMGLNPLLEDPWMVVHPPVLFIGYASLVVPFALAAAALLRRDEKDWNRMVWPWALFAVVSLGAGIALGGIWAYKTLGWGGYWGWDPVENASLVPWLVAVGLIHGLLIQRSTRSLLRTNLVLALLGWVTVIGGTYLTRSGVLQDFSVHSFADSGIGVPLLGGLVVATALGAGLLAIRWRALARDATPWIAVSREAALWLGLMTVLVLAALVTLGTTAPLLTAIAGRPGSVQTRYYTMVSVPIGIVLVLLMALAPALRWSRQQGLGWVRALMPGLVAAPLLPLGLFLAGVHDPSSLALIAVAGLALGVNAGVSVRLFRRGWSYGAGYLVHVGIAVMVLGMVASAVLGRSQRVSLERGVPANALGFSLTLRDVIAGERGQQTVAVDVRREGWSFDARPVLIPAPGDQGMVRKPAFDAGRDFYLSPIEIREGAAGDPLWLSRGQDVELGDARVSFAGFQMESHQDLMVRAALKVERQGTSTTYYPAVRAGTSGNQAIPAEVPGIGPVTIARIDADRGRVAFQLPGRGGPLAVLELSTKPFLNLVWIGAVLALLGSGLAGLRRAIERRVPSTRVERAAPVTS